MEISPSAASSDRERIFCAFEIDLDLSGAPNVESRRGREVGMPNARVMRFRLILGVVNCFVVFNYMYYSIFAIHVYNGR